MVVEHQGNKKPEPEHGAPKGTPQWDESEWTVANEDRQGDADDEEDEDKAQRNHQR